MLLLFTVLSFAFGLAIAAWRRLTGQEQWQLTKLIAYSIMCMFFTVVLLTTIVILF